jgi:DDE superfamily endonuclease
MACSILPAEVAQWTSQLAGVLHAACAWRLAPLTAGLLFARGRRTVASWLRAGGLGRDYQDYYYFLGTLGRNIKALAGALLRLAIPVISPGQRLLFAIDDTPTKRYGPKVEGAGIHHNPTPGPAGQKFLYGHVWVTLSWLVRHRCWGTIGLPLLAALYIRQVDIPKIAWLYRLRFQTKLEQAASMVEWLAGWLRYLRKTLWVVVDGAYAKRPFLKRAQQAGAIVISRLRKDAALWSVPVVLPPGKRRRGKPRIYGKERISLAKRAGHKQGWQGGTFPLYGSEVQMHYKTFLATYKPAGGLIRVVLTWDDSSGWRAYFCTDPNARVAEILEAVADRAAIEQNFHDLKEVHGVGQQQLRSYWANLGAYHLSLWLHTLIELWAWAKPKHVIVDRSASPWDDTTRRPSHADRRNALCRQSMQTEFQREAAAEYVSAKIHRLWQRLLRLTA